MNKYQKELIDKCEPYIVGTLFDALYIIPSGVLYNGFWGKSKSFNSIYVVCRDCVKEKFYLIGNEYPIDILDLYGLHLTADVPTKLNCLRFHTTLHRSRLVIKEILSELTIEEVKL